MSAGVEHRNEVRTSDCVYVQEATLYVGGLDERVDEELLWELFLQVGIDWCCAFQFGPVVSVSMPKDKVLNKHMVGMGS